MGEERQVHCIGGPFDGRDIELAAGVNVLCPCLTGDCEAEPFVYHRTRPTDTNWRDTIDHNWFMHGTPEPVPSKHVLEWHERDWMSPEVAAIRGAVREAADKFR
jgi:hypothetical protein